MELVAGATSSGVANSLSGSGSQLNKGIANGAGTARAFEGAAADNAEV